MLSHRIRPDEASIDAFIGAYFSGDSMVHAVTNDLDRRFEQAQRDVKHLTTRPGNLSLLRLYALYKQAVTGPAPAERPGITDITGRYKHDAWASLGDMTPDAAKTAYIGLADELVQDDLG